MTVLLTDSSCDLSPQELRRMNVSAVPLDILMGGQSYTDWADVDSKAIFRELQQGKPVSTEPPSTEAFVQAYKPLLERGGQILSLHISAKVSETVLRAREAAEYLKASDRIHIVDSGFSSVGLAEQVLRAAELLARDCRIEDILRALSRLRQHTHGEFCVGSLEYLRRAGRLSKPSEMLSGLFGLRPILAFRTGQLVPVRSVPEAQAMDNIIRHLEKRFGNEPISVTAINAGQDSDRISELKTALEHSNLNIQRGRLQLFGAAVGADVGPGSYGFMAVPMELLR